ncbi:lipopolysaccharide heptosyltransferase I [Pyrinomonas sp.]|uniref:lipopolysaccharide heptosyltransferase I n=1 Tax=Pyrinomonas sp. TaxID=2080306 RepID=UPI00332F258F
MRILIVKLSSIGDVVHALPTLAAIRCALPHAEISWVVERRAAEILQDNSSLDRLIEVDTKALRRASRLGETLLVVRQQLRRLRAQPFDVALDLQGLIKSAFLARLAGAERRCGFARDALREPASRFLLTETYRVPLRAHVIARNLALAAQALAIDVPKDPEEYRFPITVAPEHECEAARLIATVGGSFALLNPGGGWPTKLWDAERFGELADALWRRFGLPSIITHGPGEIELAQRAARACRANAVHVASPSLKGFYALARRARVYVGGDTGPTHLAVAAGAPIVGIFGPTEWWRNGSPRAADICVERTDIGCRENCHRRSCSRWVCMEIETERVFNAVAERLRRAAKAEAFASQPQAP